MKEYKLVIVNFYAEWCHFCRNLEPIYEAASEQLEDLRLAKRALLAKVDSVAQEELAQKYGISKYPTLKVYRDGYMQKAEYRGKRTLDDLVNFVKEELKDPYTIIPGSAADLHSVKSGLDDNHVIGAFTSLDDNNAEFAMFKRVASALHGNCKFFAIGAASSQAEGLYFRAHDEWIMPVPAPLRIASLSMEEAVALVKEKCTPRVRELDFGNAEEITEEGLPLVILFYAQKDKETKRKFVALVENQLATEKSVNFVSASGELFIHPLQVLGKSMSDLPLIATDSFQHMYTMQQPYDEVVTDSKHMKQFIADLHSGKLHREFHYGPDKSIEGNAVPTSTPPASAFKKLAPSRLRYSLPHDEF